MTQIQKLCDKDPQDKNNSGAVRSFLYILSLSFLIFWGYVKDNNSVPAPAPAINKNISPVKQDVPGEGNDNDSTYYAFSKEIIGYGRDRN